MIKSTLFRSCVLALTVMVLLAACATAPAIRDMVPAAVPAAFPSTGKNLTVAAVTGGGKTNPLTTSTIEDEGFLEALLAALKASGLFREVSAQPGGAYELKAAIISQEVSPGLTMSASLFVNYTLLDPRTRREVWKENIFSQYDATLGEAAYGVTRVKKANEGAARENLSQLVKKLGGFLSQ